MIDVKTKSLTSAMSGLNLGSVERTHISGIEIVPSNESLFKLDLNPSPPNAHRQSQALIDGSTPSKIHALHPFSSGYAKDTLNTRDEITEWHLLID